MDPNVDSIVFKFSENIVKMGEKKIFRADHGAKLDFGGIECVPTYPNLKTVSCKLKKPLTPNRDYTVKLKMGFAGAKLEDKINNEHSYTFRTSGLAITKYNILWNDNVPVIGVTLNLKVKPEGRSGVIQCPDRDIPVTFEPMKNPKVDTQFRIKSSAAIKANEFCVFYFNKPLSYSDYQGSDIPTQKMLVNQTISSLEGNIGKYDFDVGCLGNYQMRAALFQGTLPFLKCEFNDSVKINFPSDSTKSLKIDDFVTVMPKDKVKITYDYGQIIISDFSGPQKNYLIRISKNYPFMDKTRFNSDVIFQLETLDNPPLISPVKDIGVIERDSPWLVGYSALNIKAFDLFYNFVDDPRKLADLTEIQLPANMQILKKAYTLKTEANVNELRPLDVKALAKEKSFKAGLFSGRMKITDVDAKFVDAEKAIFTQKDDYSREQLKARREFSFGYLFTDIGLHVKKGRQGVLVWAFSLKTGKSLNDVTVRLTGSNISELKTSTDKDGLAFFEEVTFKNDDQFSVVAQKGDDISFISKKEAAWNSSWNNGISRYEFNLGYYWQDPTPIVADIVADRPLYLPKETVHLKFFVRKQKPDSLELESIGKKVKVTIFDSRGNEALVKELELNKYGTAVLNYELPTAAPLGRYAVYIQEGATTLQLDSVFQVEEFRKPDFKVIVTEKSKTFEGNITYFKGGAVKGAQGEMVVMFEKINFKPKNEDHERFVFPSTISTLWEYYGENSVGGDLRVLSRADVESDDKGHVVLNKGNLEKEANDYGAVVVEASFKDENGGAVSGRTTLMVNPFIYIPGISLQKWMYQTGETINPEVVAIGQDGNPALDVKMQLKLVRVDYIYERRLGSGNYFYYDSRREEKTITTCDFSTKANFKSCDLVVKEPGYYEYHASVKDKKIKADETKVSSYVYRSGEFLSFESANHDRMNLNVEKTKLKMGDKLKVMAISPLQDAEALITFERDGILYKEKVSFKGNVLLYEKVITDEKLIPGFFVSVVIVKGRTSDKIEGKFDLGKPAFKIGYKRIEVANIEKRLTAVVTPSKKQAEPGQMMEAEIQLNDNKGKGVQGELAIAVIDEALLSVSGPYQKNYDILDTFYTLKTLGVDNYQTLTQLIGRRTFGKKGANAGGGGGFEVRSDFKNTAYWEPQAETDKSGQYKFKFKIPDNLTTWKIIVSAVDNNHRFGMGENEFLASKSLMVEPALPNFLTEGDKFNAKVVVSNRSGAKEKVVVKISSPKFKVNKAEETLFVAHDGKNSTLFPLEVIEPVNSEILVTAQTNKSKDAFKVTLPVLKNSIEHVYSDYGLVGKNKKEIPLSINSFARPESLGLLVKTSSTAIEGLDEVFRYVLGYPYGCWEQKLTKAYFLVQYEAMKNLLTYRFPEDKGSISASVQTLLNEAADYQVSSGGMRYYPGGSDSGDVYLSLFTGQAFNTMKKLGYKVDEEVMNKLKAYLKNLLVSEQYWEIYYYKEARNSTRALILNVLTEMGEKDLATHISKLYSDRLGMDLFGLSYLGGYLSTQKGFEKETKTIFDRIDSLKVQTANRTTYKEPFIAKTDMNKFWNYTDTRNVCAVLQNLVTQTNDKEALSGVVRGILLELNGGHWYNTQENIFCFEGLRRFVQKFEKTHISPVFFASVDDEEVSKAAVTTARASTLEIKEKPLRIGSKNLFIQSKEDGELYYSAVLRYETPYAPRPKTKEGFELTKVISKLVEKDGKKAWENLSGATIKIKRSDILKIHLTVNAPAERYQVMLSDGLAGCLEPINTQLATASQASTTLMEKKKSYEWESPYYHGSGFEYMDLRLTAAQFYSRKLKKGTSEVEYLVQVVATGEFNMPEAHVEEMYYPDVRATEVGRKLIVEE